MGNVKWIEGLAYGDPHIIREIYEAHLPKVRSWILANSGSQAEAMDVFQEALTQILISHQKGKLNIKSTFGAYLMGTCKYIWLGTLRKKSKEDRVRSEAPLHIVEESTYRADQMETLLYKSLERTKHQLSQLCNQLITLIQKEATVDEIAHQLNMTNANTVYRRKFACFKRWRELMEQDKDYITWKDYQID